MADWIKMRSSLLTNLKVIRMARVLLQDQEFVSWLCPGRVTSRDESVTKRDIPVVTRIVVGALLPTWSSINDTAARDGIVRHASSHDIDETAGVPGFGRALMAVDWLVELPGNDGVQFVNFEEHNSPQKERSLTAKPAAERQKEYRKRKAAEKSSSQECDVTRDTESDVTRDITVTSQSDDREEKKREEKKKPPKAPQGAIEVPDWIPGKQWEDFVAMRRAKGAKAPFTVGAARGIVAKLDQFRVAGHDIAAVLEKSVINAWSDVYEPNGGATRGAGGAGQETIL